MSGPLILSVFPGIDSGESEAFRRGDSSMEHCVVVRTENPDVVALRVAGPYRHTMPSVLVVDVDNLILAAHHAFPRHIGAATKETRNSTRPAAVVDLLGVSSVVGVPGVESLSGKAPGFFEAGIGTVGAAPVVSVSAWEFLSAETTGPRPVGRLAMGPQVILASVLAGLAWARAEALIHFPRSVFGSAVITLASRILGKASNALFSASLSERHV